jgi:hypothetical protein
VKTNAERTLLVPLSGIEVGIINSLVTNRLGLENDPTEFRDRLTHLLEHLKQPPETFFEA